MVKARVSDRTRCHGELAPEALAELIRSLLADGMSAEVEVTGSSMWPFIRSGDVITLEPGEPRIGDVAAVVDPDRRLLVHRVVARDRGAWLTRGDASGGADPPVEAADLVGSISAVTRDGEPLAIGLGAGKRVLAILSRLGWLAPLMRVAARVKPGDRRKPQ